MRFEKSAGFVVFRKTDSGPEYLLLQNSSKPFWDFPKGLLDAGESEEEAARREAFEEAGLKDVKMVHGFKEKATYFYRLGGETIHKDLVMFLGAVSEGDVKLSWEHSAFEWLPFDEAKKRLTKQKLELLERAERFLRGQLKNWEKR